MRCKDMGTLCKNCSHKKKNGECSQGHWLDMIGIARGTKPTKSLYTPRLRRKLK